MSIINELPIESGGAGIALLEEDAVYCQRCSGLMVSENFYDWGAGAGQLEFSGWRCLSCGNIWDHVIAAHQRHVGESCDIEQKEVSHVLTLSNL